MPFLDITSEDKNHYRFKKPGTFIVFAKNRSGNIEFTFEHPDTKAFLFFTFEGKKEENFSLTTLQKHVAKNSESHLLVKSVLDNTAHLAFSGTIRIEKNAPGTIASLNNKNLLLGKHAGVISEPKLEILENDVRCRHAATTAPLNTESLSYLHTRGIPPKKAKHLLVQGFLSEVVEQIHLLQEKFSHNKKG